MKNKEIIEKIKRSVIFLGYKKEGRDVIIGTGFLIKVENVYHLVTAKHVIENDSENLLIFLNGKHLNSPIAKPLTKIYKDGLSWIRHPNPNVDIAIIPFLLEENDDVEFVPDDIILKDTNDLEELVNVFFSSYQPGLNNFKEDGCVNPIIRKGMISRINNNDTFFIDGFAFPGNSGSPVFVFPDAFEMYKEEQETGVPLKVNLIGIVGARICFEDIAISRQTGKPKISFEENTGLSLIWSTKFIMEITKSEQFKRQLARIRAINQVVQKAPVLPIKQVTKTDQQSSIEKPKVSS